MAADESCQPLSRMIPRQGTRRQPNEPSIGVLESPIIPDFALRRLLCPDGVDGALEAIVAAALDLVGPAARAGLTLTESDGAVPARACSDDIVAALDALETSIGEGPRHDAVRDGQVLVDDVAACGATRWPRFAPIARNYQVASVCALRLMDAGGQSAGVLTLYADRPRALGAKDLGLASLIASHGAVALRGVLRAEGLGHALRSRDVIGQAKGILIERHGLSEDQAYERLVHASQDTNIKLREVAAWLVDSAVTASANRRNG